jgi:hypothetical protein
MRAGFAPVLTLALARNKDGKLMENFGIILSVPGAFFASILYSAIWER